MEEGAMFLLPPPGLYCPRMAGVLSEDQTLPTTDGGSWVQLD